MHGLIQQHTRNGGNYITAEKQHLFPIVLNDGNIDPVYLDELLQTHK